MNTLLDQKDYKWVTIYNAEILASLSSQEGLPFMVVDCRLKKKLKVRDRSVAINIRGSWLKEYKVYEE